MLDLYSAHTIAGTNDRLSLQISQICIKLLLFILQTPESLYDVP